MNALRQEVFRMIETMPDEGTAELIRYMNEHNRKLAAWEQRALQNCRAFDDLMSLCKSVPERDEKMELAESREEHFGNAYIKHFSGSPVPAITPDDFGKNMSIGHV